MHMTIEQTRYFMHMCYIFTVMAIIGFIIGALFVPKSKTCFNNYDDCSITQYDNSKDRILIILGMLYITGLFFLFKYVIKPLQQKFITPDGDK